MRATSDICHYPLLLSCAALAMRNKAMKSTRPLVLIISTLMFVCHATYHLEAQPSARDEQALKDQEECTANLKIIFAAIRAYRSDHNDLPNWLSDLVPQYLTNQSALVCPISKRTGEYPQ